MKYSANSWAQPWQSPYICNSGSNYGGSYGNYGGGGSWGSSSYSYQPYVVSSNWSPPVYPRPNPNVINNALNRANLRTGGPWQNFYSIPVIGPALESGDQLQAGNYAMAGIAFTYAVADIFTLGYASKYKIAAKGGTELFNFGKTAAEHMANSGRKVPIQILKDVIKNTKGLPDPGGSKALMHYTQLWKNGKIYNLEILYDKASNSIWHFKYTQDPLGPLLEIPK